MGILDRMHAYLTSHLIKYVIVKRENYKTMLKLQRVERFIEKMEIDNQNPKRRMFTKQEIQRHEWKG